MAVLAKLNKARRAFHSSKIKKTGRNTFSNYDYFELGDFLVPALQIFDELQMSAVVSFGKDLATMTLTDLEDGSQFWITSPMSTASLKACHEVQNLGAVQTYLRRYLWVAALEIVEHDAVDSSAGPDKKALKKQEDKAAARQAELDELALVMIEAHEKGDDLSAIRLWYAADTFTGFDPNEERKYVWECLKSHSKLRSTIKVNRPDLQPITA